MGKLIVYLGVIAFVVLASFRLILAAEVVWEDIGDGHLNVSAVLVDPKKPQNIYFGSDQGIFQSTDSGKNWSYVFSLKGENRSINSLVYGSPSKDSLYAATKNGLFYSPDKSNSWKRIFQGQNSSEKDCLSLAVLGGRIYLATKGGLFVSADLGKSWKRQANQLGYSKVLAIAGDLKTGSPVYAACIEGVFRTENNSVSWDKVFSAHPAENGQDQEFQEEDKEEEELFSTIRYIAIDPQDPGRVFLATSSGIYQSFNKGNSWKSIPDQGLNSKEVRFLAINPNSQIYAATSSGIYIFQEDKWRDLSLRLVSGKINGLWLGVCADLFAASSKGLFKSQNDVRDEISASQNDGKPGFLGSEPEIAAVQQAAMKFAEVEPEKIRQWRIKAAKKAWLPQISLGLNRDTTDLWHWESGSTTKELDDDLRRGRDSLDWDVRLSWNLGDLVWSDDQTSIDVRSRLTVQLRNDILDEVTKIYFERIRLKTELNALDIWDKNKIRDKELRILELNAYLDALTGGYFSRSIPKTTG
ncbi:MAG: hypothetical protein NTY14_00765 [Candidatus Omnitrophica bacterium]|nr:hypothetical protein [Candidatus Omnitrophota bacterium]